MDVISTHHARRLASGEVIRHAAAHHYHIACHQRGGGLLIVAGFDFTHAHAKVNHAVVAKVFTQLAVVGVKRNQTGIGGRQEQTARAGGRLRCGW